jgi:hypothetical protein
MIDKVSRKEYEKLYGFVEEGTFKAEDAVE